MRSKWWVEPAAVILFLVAATVVIAACGADLTLSSRFCIDGKWPVGDTALWQLFYRLDRIPSFFLALFGLAAGAASYFRKELKQWRRSGVFLVLLLALGPGLMVNAVFKDHWGRPRPREITQFGGKKQFLQPWQKGEDGKGRSFPSGHASAAFYMSAPFFIYRRSNKRLALFWLTGGLIFGILMSFARITQGGHFLSDNLWAWGMVHLCALALAALLKVEREPTAASVSDEEQCST
jgi:membrane-associated PAP2 superfamily phosphatase